MKSPKHKKKLPSFLGMIQYMNSFTSKMSDFVESLRKLIKDDVEFQQMAAQEKHFDELKEIII